MPKYIIIGYIILYIKRRTQIAFHSFNMRMKKKKKRIAKNKRNTLSTTERSLCMISRPQENRKKNNTSPYGCLFLRKFQFLFSPSHLFMGEQTSFSLFFSYFLFSHYSMTNTLYRMYILIPRMPHFIHEQTQRYLTYICIYISVLLDV